MTVATALVAFVGGIMLGASVCSTWAAWHLHHRVTALMREVDSVERDAMALAKEGQQADAERCDAYARGLRHGALLLHWPAQRSKPPRIRR